MEQDPQSETDSDEGPIGTVDTYVVDNIVQHIGSGPRLRYSTGFYGCIMVDDTAKAPHDIPQHFTGSYCRRFDM